MEGGSLFNPGFLGASFLWWVGQIVDDSTWRDNIHSGKYDDKNSIPGWGRRYKVRIIGLHDQGEKTIPSDQLPWAQLMYPVTGGGGQAGAKQTPNLRQGNMVFGFFLDGQEKQVPVIMGVLGNNSQTELSQKNSTVDDTVSDTQPGSIAKSGYADGTVEKEGSARETPPDGDLGTQQPSPGKSGATNENSDGVHQITAADTKRQAKCEEKVVLMVPDPDEFVTSAMKGIQTAIDNLVTRIDGILQSLQSYVDAVSTVLTDIQKIISDFACEIAKYMKVIFDKIMEYVLKILNKALNAVVAAMPSSLRYQFSDMKQILTELILCLYNKMTGNLCEKIEGALNGAIKPLELEQEVRDKVANNDPSVGVPTNPSVPMCYAETITSQVLAASKDEIDSANNNLVNNLNAYLEDVNDQLSGIEGFSTDISNLIPDIGGSITSALSFTNISLNIFGCELKPNVAVSDYYTFCSGGDGTATPSKPSEKSVADGIDAQESAVADEATPFVEPTKGESNVTYDNETLAAQVTAEENALANIPPDQNPNPASNTVVRDDGGIDQALQDSQNQVPVQDGDLDIQ